MRPILVIADDLTGAAEIAGIGWRMGLPVELLLDEPYRVPGAMTVVDTDTRLMPSEQAAERVRHVLGRLGPHASGLFYKKIDSTLRGNVRAEVEATLGVLGRERAVLLPQNPSRGRVIHDGGYFINGVPLHETEFARDPHHPVRSSSVRALIGLAEGDEAFEIVNAASVEEVDRAAAGLRYGDLPVGGADFFTALLRRTLIDPPSRPPVAFEPGRSLFVCGTLSGQKQALLRQAAADGATLCPFTTTTADRDLHTIPTAVIAAGGSVVVYYGGPTEDSPDLSVRIERRLALAVQEVVSRSPVARVLIEGGATAAAVCRHMGWKRLDVIGEMAPGIVALHVHSNVPQVVVKPGSYAWPDDVFRAPRP